MYLSLCSARLTLEQTPGESLSDRRDCFGRVHSGCDVQIIFYPVLPHSEDLPATEGQDSNSL